MLQSCPSRPALRPEANLHSPHPARQPRPCLLVVVFYVFAGMLLVNLVLSAWVARSFSNNRFDVVWPIQFVRYFGLVFYQVGAQGGFISASGRV